jgi:hypothetical protein
MSVASFYEASLQTLRFVEARTPTGRRFGPDADAMWRNFKGHLTTSDRIDLLLRDADTEFPGAFGARVVFDLAGVAEDEAFGPAWTSLGTEAADLWSRVQNEQVSRAVGSAIKLIASPWTNAEPKSVAVEGLTPATKIVAAGAGAILSLIRAFEDKPDLSFADQVTVVASQPAERQFAALAAPLLNSPKPTRILKPSSPPPPGRFDRVLVSADADPADAAYAEQLGTR